MSFFTTPPPRPLPTEPSTFRTRAINLFEYICTTLLTELDSFFTTVQGYAAAMNTNDTRDTSLSSVLIGTGSKTFTVSAAKSFSGGQWLTIADTAAPSTNSMVGQVTSYSGTTLIVNVPSNGVYGSGTKSSWVIALTAAPAADISAAMKPVTTAATLVAGRTALGSTTIGDAVFTAANTSVAQAAIGLTGRNALLNASMSIDQRNAGAAQTITAGAALAYTVDQWYAYCTGANVTGQRVAGSNQDQYRYRFTGAASVTGIGFAQRIEAANSYHLNGQTCTLSVDLANSVLTSVSWAAYYANTTDTFGTVAAPTRTLISSGTFTVNSTLTNYTAQISVPSAATTGIEIVFTVGAQTSGTWTIGDAQLEVGSAKTVFERQPTQKDLMVCQYYYRKYDGSDGITMVGAGRQTSTTSSRLTITHGSMFRAPTVVLGGSIIADIAGANPTVTLTTAFAGKVTTGLDVSHASNGAAGQGMLLQVSSGAANFVSLSSVIP